jgi:hypothetical protein
LFLRPAAPSILGFLFLVGCVLLLHGLLPLALFALAQPILLLVRPFPLLFLLLLGFRGRAFGFIRHRYLQAHGNIHQNASRISTRM